MAEPYRTLVEQIAHAQLTAGMKEAALNLAALADPDTGRVVFLKEDSPPVLGVEHPGTVRKYLARLAEVGLLDWKGGGKTFDVWFLAWSPGPKPYRIPPEAPVKTGAKPSPRSANRVERSAVYAETEAPAPRPVTGAKSAPWR